ncbi:hypothetical protein B0T16DRAFT_128486 [Cercophora newfieldiana]|uniref:Uncharacterized protein n=1 Tax=Cercophora newfieldiana TaxID=92897 RepID=A0AA39YCD4_9PEZI|nr:hypothetical protein B0T16DRAFT_128486 [Cercophora newfieldiana]
MLSERCFRPTSRGSKPRRAAACSSLLSHRKSTSDPRTLAVGSGERRIRTGGDGCGGTGHRTRLLKDAIWIPNPALATTGRGWATEPFSPCVTQPSPTKAIGKMANRSAFALLRCGLRSLRNFQLDASTPSGQKKIRRGAGLRREQDVICRFFFHQEDSTLEKRHRIAEKKFHQRLGACVFPKCNLRTPTVLFARPGRCDQHLDFTSFAPVPPKRPCRLCGWPAEVRHAHAV